MADVTRPVVLTRSDVEQLVETARRTLAEPSLDPDIRSRLDSALGRLTWAANAIVELSQAARWLADDWPADPRPCRFESARGRFCGRPENDLPSHGESFAAHTYLPERRAPRPPIGPGSDRRAVVRGTGQWE